MNTPLSNRFSLSSQILQDTVSLEIALPEGYDAFSEKEYASIYLLDANYFFDEEPGTLDDYLVRGEGMTKTVQTLSAKGKISPSVLIGIDYTEDQRMKFMINDVTNFHQFFTDELIPEIESRFRVSKSGKDRVLFGYSGSAHFSTFVLLYDGYTGRETFNKVISISGVYFESLESYKLEEQIFAESGRDVFSGRRLFIAVGADDPKQELVEAHRSFTEKLISRGYKGLKLASKEFPGMGHYDIAEYGFSEGLIWLFTE